MRDNVYVKDYGLSPKGVTKMTSFNLSNLQQVKATLQFLDDQGAAAPAPAGIPAWTSSDATICSVTSAEDGLSADFISVVDGTVTMTATLEALTASIDIVVGAAGIAAVMDLMMGVPTDKLLVA